MQTITCKTFTFSPSKPLLELCDIMRQSPYAAIHFTLDEYYTVSMPSLFQITTKATAKKLAREKTDTQHPTDLVHAIGAFVLSPDPLGNLNKYIGKPPELFSSVWLMPDGLFTAPLDIPSLFSPDNFNSSSYMKLGQRFHLGTWQDPSHHGFIDAAKRLDDLARYTTKTILHLQAPAAKEWHLLPTHDFA